MFGHLRLLRRVDARRALQRHLLHFAAEVWPLLLLLGRRLCVWVISANGSRHACGVAVVYGRLVAACAEFLRVARVQCVDAVRADLTLKSCGWRRAWTGVLVSSGLLWRWLTANDRALWCLWLVLNATGNEVKRCRSVGWC